MSKTAILIDGGFYRKRAKHLWGDKTAIDRSLELIAYCKEHLKDTDGKQKRDLYRIFYYDCLPYEKSVFHPYFKKNINLKKTGTYTWSLEFFEELKKKRKVALRFGKLSDITAGYNLKPELTRKIWADLPNAQNIVSQLTETDFVLSVEQKGVDMKIGLDISSIAFKHQADQIILISGDSNFVPAAKQARREGIDFILDPMWATIKPDLFEHIDGLSSKWKKSCKI